MIYILIHYKHNPPCYALLVCCRQSRNCQILSRMGGPPSLELENKKQIVNYAICLAIYVTWQGKSAASYRVN